MKKHLGDILVETEYITREQLDMALMEGKKTGQMMGDVLLRLGWLTEEQLQIALAVQSGAKLLNVNQTVIDPAVTARVPMTFAAKHAVFPICIKDGVIRVATPNPFNVLARDELGRMTGLKVETFVAPKDWVANAIDIYYKTTQNIDREIEEITMLSGAQTVSDARVVRLADLIVDKGYILGASDIHIVPDTRLTRIYFRIDGVLQQHYLFAKTLHATLVTRFKVKGDMDISNPNIPHDGRFKFSGISTFNVRVSTFPTHLGETVVMRLLVYGNLMGDLSTLGFEENEFQMFMKNLRRPYGLILTTGPTGSGKTTTLYSALLTINDPKINVMTIEDPIEFVIPTIRQSAVNTKAGFDFVKAMRATVRQDPDVILVGEIRDSDTAELALRASITGHLVLSTLHTNDAASAINRLLDLGVNASMLSAALSLVVAQRLMRRVCRDCGERHPVTPEELELFESFQVKPPETVAVAKGCDKCRKSGYVGRVGIYEVLQITRTIEELIYQGALHSVIEEAAKKEGTRLLITQALSKAASGVTTIDEVNRVVSHA